MKKSEIKNGAIVKLKNGGYYLKVDKTLLEVYIVKKSDVEGGPTDLYFDNFCIFLTPQYMPLDKYENNLTYKTDNDWSIIAVNNNTDNSRGYCNQVIAKVIKNGFKAIDNCELSLLTKQEKVIINSIDNSIWKYIARDENGHLYLYLSKPKKYDDMWDSKGDTNVSDFWAFDRMFRFISWNDPEPFEVAKLQSEKTD